MIKSKTQDSAGYIISQFWPYLRIKLLRTFFLAILLLSTKATRTMIKNIGLTWIFFISIMSACKHTSNMTVSGLKKRPLNVVMIAVDDLRPTLGVYGDTLVKTPNIDRLAAKGVVFMNSFCNIPVCGASRASILTSKRPTRYRFLRYNANSSKQVPNAISLNEHFKKHGYSTISNGKIFHIYEDRAQGWNENWRLQKEGERREYVLPKNIALELVSGGPPYERAPVHDTLYNDGKLTAKTISDLKKLKKSGKPFFLASGFVKPHLPFNAPSKYWDLYQRADFRPALQEFWPKNAPKEAFHNSGELRTYHNVPKKGFVGDSLSVTLQHGYYACISYIDAQIGQILDTLETLELLDHTIVLLWGDHGWNLGDHGIWNKHCNFDTSLSAPLIISAPGKARKQHSDAMVEFIDIFPTLSELCGLDIPETVDGKSLVPLLETPHMDWTSYVISKFKNGLTIRTKEFAYTEYRTDDDSLISRMLYNHKTDPLETDNVVSKVAYKKLVDSLQKIMLKNRGDAYFDKPPPLSN